MEKAAKTPQGATAVATPAQKRAYKKAMEQRKEARAAKRRITTKGAGSTTPEEKPAESPKTKYVEIHVDGNKVLTVPMGQKLELSIGSDGHITILSAS
jgi:sRNA-binding protein